MAVSISPKKTRAFIIALTWSFSSAVQRTSSLRISIRLSSSKGEPSLTYRFFLIFFFCFLSGLRFESLLVWEKPLDDWLPDVLLSCDPEKLEAPDIDIWSASKPRPAALRSRKSDALGMFFF